ncbi:MAG TPA: glycosyltransferase family 39 protein [Kofleriaceae bacterium]|nr:glycosyltransferase family 39 protein [Kofleriaceae bacterium]
MEPLSRYLGRWPIALACVVVLAAAVLLPGLGTFGIWEPQERQLADRVAPRAELAKQQASAMPQTPPPAPKDGCWRIAPPDSVARTLTNKAMVFGRDTFGDSDAGRRLPLALLGLIAVLAAAGIAMRSSGPRAGIVTALVLLSMPLLVFQSRQLTSEIGTATGATLIIYGLLALGRPAQRWWWIDLPVSLFALAAGCALAFMSGGALLGLLVPLAAFAVAGKLGVPFAIDVGRAARNGALRVAKRVAPRFAVGREPTAYVTGDNWPAFVATLFTIAVIGVLAYQIFSLVEPQPGMTPPQRALFGKAVVTTGCWSSALGGIWRPDDDLRYVFDSTFEQIAYGTFPWGILGIVAMAALLASDEPRKRLIGALTLAWAGGAWITAEVFQRKVGFTIWAGFPALAIAVGVWLDSALASRAMVPAKDRSALPKAAILIGLFVALAIVNLGKDMQSFSERISSLLIGSDQIAYPKMSKLLFLPTRVWILVVGALVATGFVLAMLDFRRVWRQGIAIALGGTVLAAAFWSFGWLPALARNLSSKAMFDTYLELRKPGDQLVIMGDMGDAPHDYAPDAKVEQLTSRDQIVQAIGRPNRVFAIAPQTELCQLHREIGGKDYFVLDDRNTRSLLLSNKVTGTTDKNPLRTAILHSEPINIPIRPKGKIVFDGRIELLGWSMPKRVGRGDKFEVMMVYKVLQPVPGNWRVLFHFDGALRFNGDHEPIKGRCQTSTWQPGDFIVDRYTVTAGAGAFTPGPYDVWTGFFTGSNPNWKNMTVSEAPADMRDQADRVKITTITLD